MKFLSLVAALAIPVAASAADLQGGCPCVAANGSCPCLPPAKASPLQQFALPAVTTLRQVCRGGVCSWEAVPAPQTAQGSTIVVNPTAAQAPVVYRQMEAPAADNGWWLGKALGRPRPQR